jgi:hypothetical protein
MTAFMSGRELNRAFYAEIVGPLVAAWQHSAALLGWGSDVLGFDTVRSTDHGWGPRVLLFADAADVDEIAVTSQRRPCHTPCARIVPSYTNPARRATATDSSFSATIVRTTRAAPSSNNQRVSRITARVA